MSKKKLISILYAAIILLVLAAAALLLYNHHVRQRSKAVAEELAAQVHAQESMPPQPSEAPVSETSEANSEVEPSHVPSETEPPRVLAQYAQLYEQNHDFTGWLKIDNTVIDYPVMYTPEEQDTYLYQDFNGEHSYAGTLFIGCPWNPLGSTTIIYGHNMKDGSMFGRLTLYESKNYTDEHPTIGFDTLVEQRDYTVFAALYSKVYSEEEEEGRFCYYNYPVLADQETFEYYVEQVREASLYDTGITPVWGDKLLVLSTCDYHTNDGRFAVFAYSPGSAAE